MSFLRFLQEATIVRQDDKFIEVATKFGEPAVAKIKQLGARWDPLNKIWKVPADRLDHLKKIIDIDEVQSDVELKHSKSYQYREFIKKQGGRWDGVKKIWVMPSQHAYDKVIAHIDEHEPSKSGTIRVGELRGIVFQGSEDHGKLYLRANDLKKDRLGRLLRDHSRKFWMIEGIEALFIPGTAEGFEHAGPLEYDHWTIKYFCRPATSREISAQGGLHDAKDVHDELRAFQKALHEHGKIVVETMGGDPEKDAKIKEFKKRRFFRIPRRDVYLSGAFVNYNRIEIFSGTFEGKDAYLEKNYLGDDETVWQIILPPHGLKEPAETDVSSEYDPTKQEHSETLDWMKTIDFTKQHATEAYDFIGRRFIPEAQEMTWADVGKNTEASKLYHDAVEKFKQQNHDPGAGTDAAKEWRRGQENAGRRAVRAWAKEKGIKVG